MKKVMVLALLGLASASSFGTEPCQFVVSPNPGVTGDQLTQAQVNAIGAHVSDCYKAKMANAEAAYAEAVQNLDIDPSIDHSGEILNCQEMEALKAREAAFHAAVTDALAEGNAACDGLCTVTRMQAPPAPLR